MDNIIQMMMGAAGAGGEYEISRSLRFNSADSAYLSRTPGSAGNRRTWTWSGWVKRSVLSSQTELFGVRIDSNNQFRLYMSSSNKLDIYNQISGVVGARLITTQVFRDLSAWYHIVFVMDTTNATAGDRMRLYINGLEVTAFDTDTQPSQNYDTQINTTNSHTIGEFGGSQYLDGYLTEINFIDGQALTPSSFGETNPDTGVWQPKEYTGTYGTNGFYLNFSDNSNTTASTLGKDYSGNGNNWTPNNFSVTAGAGNDSLVDTPTPYGTDTGAGGEVRGNYCTLNPIVGPFSSTTFSNGNLNMVVASGNFNKGVTGTFLIPRSGKYYFEVLLESGSGTGGGIGVGFGTLTKVYGNSADLTVGSWVIQDGGSVRANGSVVSTVSSWSTDGKICGVTINYDASEIKFYVDNSLQATLSGANFPTVDVVPYIHNSARGVVANFGQRPFAYTAPSGFKALVTTNLPDPTVVQGDDYFNTVLYTGTGSSQNITGVGFQPDFVWIKERNGAADHALYDAVRGVQQQLESNTTTDETTESTGLTAFGTNGFTVGSLAQVNTSTDTYVAWNWKESTVSKFDIVTYTGNGTARTISHNLGVVPNMIIVKARTTASTDQGWPVYHSANTANPETDYLLLNSTAATADLDTVWNDTAPTSSVFSVGTNALVNANNDTYVAYLFANVAGYSAFGSYTGNGSTDGTFVYTGFRPAFVVIKCTSAADNWLITDSKRNTYNVVNTALFANLSNADTSGYSRDFLSNGFKLRDDGGSVNANGATYIYMAFSEVGFKYALGR